MRVLEIAIEIVDLTRIVLLIEQLPVGWIHHMIFVVFPKRELQTDFTLGI
jgi:hypothetical protein